MPYIKIITRQVAIAPYKSNREKYDRYDAPMYNGDKIKIFWLHQTSAKNIPKEKGFKTFRILTNFVQNPNSQTLFRQVSDICEVYKEDNEKSAKRYIYSKSLIDAPVKKWKNKDCNAKEFAKLEKESKKIIKEIS